MRRLGPVFLLLASLAILADDGDAARKRIQAKRRALDADQAEKRAALADWCADKGLLREARDEYDKAIALVGGNETWTRARDNLQSRSRKKNRPVDPGDQAEYGASKKKLAEAYGRLYGELAAQAREAGLDDLADELEALVAAAPEAPKDGPPKNGRKEPPPAAPTPEQILERVNAYRQLAGLPAVSLDDMLTSGAQSHADYIHVNRIKPGVDLHIEIDSFRGWTAAGSAAGPASEICWGPPSSAVDQVMSGVFRRLHVLHPGLERIGAGFQHASGEQVSVIDLRSGLREHDVERVVVFPVPDQIDVPTTFGGETPDPLPAGAPRDAGYPITLTQYHRERGITEATATLIDAKGRPVEVHLLTPDAATDPKRPGHTVAMIPVRPLAGATTYTATVKCRIQHVPFEKTWSFTTK